MAELERMESGAAAGGLSPGTDASVLVEKVADSLAVNMSSDQPKNPNQLFNLCLSLSRAVDVSIASHKVPSRTLNLVTLLREVCKHASVNQAAVMVLMVSIKNACKAGWFTDKDAIHLLTLAKEVAKVFSDTEDMNAEDSYVSHIISKIILRFYPTIKMGRVLVSLKIKPGYRVLVEDLNIPKKTASSTQEEIGLFVVRVGDMESSSCIQTPPLANFLINGEGVQGRVNASMDTGPQLPTKVTSMLNYGTNFFQVVGQFDGEYIIVLAYMTEIQISGIPVLQDYVWLDTPSDKCSDDGDEQSKISLNCPISTKRIRTPVKGHFCKHFQCFDYENFVVLNSKSLLWLCPVCGRSIFYSDIRIDQSIAKILQEVGGNTTDVIISANGCWRVIFETDDKERCGSAAPIAKTAGICELPHLTSSLPSAPTTTSSSPVPFQESVDLNGAPNPLLQSLDLCNNVLQVNHHGDGSSNADDVFGRNNPAGLIRWSREIVDRDQCTARSEILTNSWMPNGASFASYQNMPVVGADRTPVNILPVSNVVSLPTFSTRGSPQYLYSRGMETNRATTSSLSVFPSQQYPYTSNTMTSVQATRHMAQAPKYPHFCNIMTSQAPQCTNQAGISTQSIIQAQNYQSGCSVQAAQNSTSTPQFHQSHSGNRVAVTARDKQLLSRTDSRPTSHIKTRTPPFVAVQLKEPESRPIATSSRVGEQAHQVPGKSSAKENWRPGGRMRGSLTGQAYANALKELLTPSK